MARLDEWKQFELLCHRLSVMMSGGISLHRSLQFLIDDAPGYLHRRQLTLLKSELERGAPFSRAFRYILPVDFSGQYGTIDHLPNIILFLDRWKVRVAGRRQTVIEMRKRWIYPAILMVSTLSTMVFFVGILVPRYIDFFNQSNTPVPGIISLLMRVRSGCQSPIGVGACIGLGVVLLPVFRKKWAGWISSGGAVNNSISDTFWMIGLLLQSGVSLSDAMGSLQRGRYVPKNWVSFEASVRHTGAFSDSAYLHLSLSKYHRELLRCGESSGDLSGALFAVSTELETYAIERTQRNLSYVQPCLILVSAGIILMSVYITMAPVTSLIGSLK